MAKAEKFTVAGRASKNNLLRALIWKFGTTRCGAGGVGPFSPSFARPRDIGLSMTRD